MASGSFEVEPGVFMAASCHHRNGSACGPCYARVTTALERIAEAPTVEAVRGIVAETHAAMRADKPKGRRS